MRELELPGSGWWLQWREDGFWREINDAQRHDEAAGRHVPGEDEWVAWTGSRQPQSRGGDWGGAAWWLLYGELPADGTAPRVELQDAAQPPVLVLGQVWACEWHAVAQPATVHIAGQQVVLPFAEPRYRREPEDTPGHGWFRYGDDAPGSR
ncbi:hypothetical protein KOI35_13495 [Actinoplanes bogorensis]|uniref:Uncharacterized protein n=1 Tax=Paractinoplanes bogorensis TaxID=1610840 RepID=A0ABS5YM24_9ACTN|nr:hypothetical protein [Actinoplanes bogorensis]MBU2664512.1 hypothetical protein [Actinoplanes bogorensis]